MNYKKYRAKQGAYVFNLYTWQCADIRLLPYITNKRAIDFVLS